MRIGLIRHGETDWNAQGLLQGSTDIPLNERGLEQARDAAGLLRGAGWDRILSSPLGRARHTAEIISEAAGLGPVGVVPELIERSFGVLEGSSYWQADGSRLPLDHASVESIDSVQERVAAAIDAIEDEFPDSSTLVVAHGSVIRLFLDSVLVHRSPHISNLSLTILERPAAGGSRLVTLANGYPLAAEMTRGG